MTMNINKLTNEEKNQLREAAYAIADAMPKFKAARDSLRRRTGTYTPAAGQVAWDMSAEAQEVTDFINQIYESPWLAEIWNKL